MLLKQTIIGPRGGPADVLRSKSAVLGAGWVRGEPTAARSMAVAVRSEAPRPRRKARRPPRRTPESSAAHAGRRIAGKSNSRAGAEVPGMVRRLSWLAGGRGFPSRLAEQTRRTAARWPQCQVAPSAPTAPQTAHANGTDGSTYRNILHQIHARREYRWLLGRAGASDCANGRQRRCCRRAPRGGRAMNGLVSWRFDQPLASSGP